MYAVVIADLKRGNQYNPFLRATARITNSGVDAGGLERMILLYPRRGYIFCSRVQMGRRE